MTLNQVISRIKQIALAHKQIKRCEYGEIEDILTDKTDRYALLWITDNGISISAPSKVTSFPFRMFFLDLVNVSADAQSNQLDVQSDMVSVAEDIIAKINYSEYTDWKVEGISPGRMVIDEENDVVSGVTIDIVISTPYEQDVCAVPETPTTNTTIEFSWFVSDPYVDIDEADFLYSMEIEPLLPSYAADFTVNGNGNYLAFKEPSTEPEKTEWFNTAFNYGIFPDQVFRTPVIISGFRYYVSRIPVILQSDNYSITLS